MARAGRLPSVTGLAVLLLCAHSARAAEDLADLIEKAEKSVVRINVKLAEGGAVGSGFIVGEG